MYGLNLEAMRRSFYMGVVMLLPDDARLTFQAAAKYIRIKYGNDHKTPACVDFTGEAPQVCAKPPHTEELFEWAKEYTKSIDSIRSTNAGYSNMLYKQRKQKSHDR